MIQILDLHGIVKYVAPYNHDYVDMNLSEQYFYKETVNTGKTRWSKTFISMSTGYPTVAVTFPLTTGMIVGYLNLARLSKIVEDMWLGESGYASIIETGKELLLLTRIRHSFLNGRI